MAGQLDGEVSSGSLSCHSQSATPFCEREKEERRRKEEAGRREEGRTWRVLRYPRSCLFSIPPLLRSSGRSRATDFQFFFELHATSSRSNSSPRPSPRLRLLRSFSLSFSCARSLPPFLFLPSASPSLILANRSW